MHELSHWLSGQHSGLKTYKAFREKSLELAKRDPRHTALYVLLASKVDRYIDDFQEAAVPVDVARGFFDRLMDLVQGAEEATSAPVEAQLQMLNRIAGVSLD